MEIVYPVHPNPNVREAVGRILAGRPRIHLVEPVRYEQLLLLMDRSVLLLTDSGGIRGRRSLAAQARPGHARGDRASRKASTPAWRGSWAPTANALSQAWANCSMTPAAYAAMATGRNPYGDGTASARIADILAAHIHV